MILSQKTAKKGFAGMLAFFASSMVLVLIFLGFYVYISLFSPAQITYYITAETSNLREDYEILGFGDLIISNDDTPIELRDYDIVRGNDLLVLYKNTNNIVRKHEIKSKILNISSINSKSSGERLKKYLEEIS